ncbi:GNAT family N-acetyltransferase [Paracoccus nototheniae]|uniref:GNAT family N-acetyltransferase n=1 Tax=Paracoccus nototheniae TaxID=2489002 RepID=A0ABW4DYZ3_9RHOB|nr:GNAT family N-acetyltransferase [Paracoccus nototheniae]
MIALAPLGRDAFGRVSHLAVAPDQEPFCGSIASHFAADEPSCDFHVVTRDDRPVGFFKIDRDYAARMDLAPPDHLGLRGMMIDRAEQGRGTGRAAMSLLRGYLSAYYPGWAGCALTVNAINPGARAIYLAGGFRDDGVCYHGGRLGPQHLWYWI